MKKIGGLKHLLYTLKVGGQVSLEKRRLRGDLINVYKYLREGCQEDGASLFSIVPSDSTRRNRHKPVPAPVVRWKPFIIETKERYWLA